jgi:hypothetical protein
MELLTEVRLIRKPDGNAVVEFSNGRSFNLLNGDTLLERVARLCLERQIDQLPPF